ncbi:MAG: hypothetical protein M1814_004548 [Vezdaea aestivalis]|nr:MAG: hypothetical protein M1814_004548 [Vezdaea aestivalis]
MPLTRSPKGFLLLVLAVAGFLCFTLILSARQQQPVDYQETSLERVDISKETLQGGVIAPKLGNETLKAELGRAAWKLFHTTMARFPDKPTADESEALRSYVHLFARLYPCEDNSGECAGHFQKLLAKFPPQVNSRSSAAAWACHVHNQVNKSLKKKQFDCSQIGDFYDCGCAEDEKGSAEKGKSSREDGKPKPDMSEERKQKLAGSGRNFDDDLLKPLKLEKEGLTRGG